MKFLQAIIENFSVGSKISNTEGRFVEIFLHILIVIPKAIGFTPSGDGVEVISRVAATLPEYDKKIEK